jgi:hypothetical protein
MDRASTSGMDAIGTWLVEHRQQVRIGWLLLLMVLAACNNSDGGGNGY